MSACLNLAAISDSNINLLTKYPKLIWTLVFPDHANLLTVNDTRLISALTPLEMPTGRRLHPEPIQLKETLGEYWHSIHYLLCGEAWSGSLPKAFLLDGGDYVGDVDVGYGPARVFCACETKKIAQALINTSIASMMQHFDAELMLDQDVYLPTGEADKASLDACLERFTALQHFMRHTAENDFGFVLYLTKN
jgi:hypothetical protein